MNPRMRLRIQELISHTLTECVNPEVPCARARAEAHVMLDVGLSNLWEDGSILFYEVICDFTNNVSHDELVVDVRIQQTVSSPVEVIRAVLSRSGLTFESDVLIPDNS